MCFIRGISHLTEQGYNHTSVDPVPYPEQVKAAKELLYEQAAAKYWEVIGYTDPDRGQACYAAALIAPKCLLDEDFWHIVKKRTPAPKNFK